MNLSAKNKSPYKGLMNYIAFLILFLFAPSFNCIAQRIAINGTDKFTDNKIYKIDVSEGSRWKTSDNIAKGLMNNIFLSTKLISNDTTKIVNSNFNLQLGRVLCVNPTMGKIIILFTDESKITLSQITAINCESNLNVEYSLGQDEFQIKNNLLYLSSKDIIEFRIYFADGYNDFVVKEDKREMIRKHYHLIEEKY